MTRRLCRVDDLAPFTSRAFSPPEGGFTGLFAVRGACSVHVYVNACPHIGVALDWMPGDVLTADRQQIVCSTHGALFAIETGLSTHGPCKGKYLEQVPVTLDDGWIVVPATAGL